jgi:hypothetical protein
MKSDQNGTPTQYQATLGFAAMIPPLDGECMAILTSDYEHFGRLLSQVVGCSMPQ